MVKKFLLENFGYNEPIFLKDLSFEGISENAMRQSIKRLVANGFLERYDSGIYYIPKRDGLLGKGYLNTSVVVERKYIQNKEEVFGYITGLSLANSLRLTTQMSAITEIVTNKEATKGRLVCVGSQKVRLKKPSITISRQNVELLQLLDGVAQAERYTELPLKDTISVLGAYIRQKHFTREQISKILPGLTGDIAKKMITWELIYEFA